MIFARKVNKISEFHMIFSRKNTLIFPDFFFGGARSPLPPVSYTYGGLY